jgi:hypothetical protein
MTEFYITGAHPWAASALLSAVPPGPPLLPHALSPEEMTWLLLDHSAAIRGIHEELALLRELLRGGLPPPPRASLPASSAAALLIPSTGPFTMETTEKMLTRHVSATVRLQAVARGLLTRRQVGGYSICSCFSPAPYRSSIRLFVATQRRRPRQRNIRQLCGCKRWRAAS